MVVSWLQDPVRPYGNGFHAKLSRLGTPPTTKHTRTFCSSSPISGEVRDCFCSGEFQGGLAQGPEAESGMSQHPSANSRPEGGEKGTPWVTHDGGCWESHWWERGTCA